MGGTHTILEKLAKDFTDDELILNQKVNQIKGNKETVSVFTEKSEFSADVVISTIPPQVFINTVDIHPSLDEKITQIANNTHTWMKNSIKFAIVYKTPFWKDKGLSGVGFSNVGPFTEIYDHSDFENNHFALMGFLNGNLSNETKTFREEKVQNQLFKFFGEDGKNDLSYEEKVWTKEKLTNFENEKFITPHFNNGNAMYQKEFLNGKFIIAGSETSPSFGGYMEGAIFRGNQIVEKLKFKFQ